MKPASTSPTLLERVRDPRDARAWSEFDARYGDLILRYCLRRGLQHSDADDVRQAVLVRLARALPGFRYNPAAGRFRSFLGRIAHNEVARFLGRQAPAAARVLGIDGGCAAPEASAALDPAWEREWMLHHVRRALAEVRQRFDAASVLVFERLLAGEAPAEVAGALGLSETAVYKIKQRVRERLSEYVAAQIALEESPGASRAEPSPRGR